MGWPSLLVLVRHAESEGNVLSAGDHSRFNKSTHAHGLTEKGKKQAKITGDYLKGQFGGFDTYYMSYYRRSRDTMSIMYPGMKVYEDARLAEAQRGIYHFLTPEQIKEKYPEELERKDLEDLFHYRAPGGESWLDVELRIHSFLATLNQGQDGQRVLAVVHGHWMNLFQKIMNNHSVEQAIERYKKGIVKNASVSVYKNFTGFLGKPNLVLDTDNFAPWEGKL